MFFFRKRSGPLQARRGPLIENRGGTATTRHVVGPQGRGHCLHRLLEFSTPNNYFTCDVCGTQMNAWRTMFGCRECNYDECENCYHPPPVDPVSPSAITPTIWTCKKCTFENELQASVCNMCEENRFEEGEVNMLGENLICSICCDKKCQVAFIECGHCVTCERCANSLFALPDRQCPICRTFLKQKPLRIYFA